MTSSLVGSEMCIRDRNKPPQHENDRGYAAPGYDKGGKGGKGKWDRTRTCLLYTSDAADDM
eukprot:3333017-Prorocentrum_lima.AAC.1